MNFDDLDHLPDGLLTVETREVQRVCPRPTLIRLPGDHGLPLFVSILLHGNEDAGLLAIQELFRHLPPNDLPRPLTIFVGNVLACQAGLRFAPGQVDFNRSWPGSNLAPSETQVMLKEVTHRVLQSGVFASIDVHNNTGRNPHYGCVCSLKPEHVELASMFSDKIVYFTRPKGVQTQAFMQHCPSVTVECGRIGTLDGAHEAAWLIRKCLEQEAWGQAGSSARVYRTIARIKLRRNCTVGFEDGHDVVFREDLDLLNFRALQSGESICKLNAQLEQCFEVHDQNGNDVTSDFLTNDEQQAIFGRPVMPSMLTKDLTVMRQDCVGYLMEPVLHSDAAPQT